jgi:glutathione reductase (NADPH)
MVITMTKKFDFDLFVIGAGSGGVRACRVASGLGAKVAVAEERYFGGTCVNVGCVPKKLMSYAAHYRDDFKDSQGFGWGASDSVFSWSQFRKNKDKEISRLEGIYRAILDSNQVTVFEQRAQITGPHQVRLDNKTLSARYILLAAGSWPWLPEFPGSHYMIDSNDVFSLEALPDTFLVVGGGYIAVEFASIFARLGCKTALTYRGNKLLRGFDTELRDSLTEEISKSVNLYLKTTPVKITYLNNKLNVLLDDGNELQTDMVLGATGRKPATANLGLETAGIKLNDQGAIEVDGQFQTSVPSVYAIGDVIDRVALTPVALAEGHIVANALFAGKKKTMDYNTIPTAIFCHPNIATVGLTEDAARAKHLDIDVYSARVKQLKHTLSGNPEKAFIKLIVDRPTDRVLGLHMMGPNAGEIVQGFAVAMNCGARKADFDNTIGIHPTLAEEFVTMRKHWK